MGDGPDAVKEGGGWIGVLSGVLSGTVPSSDGPVSEIALGSGPADSDVSLSFGDMDDDAVTEALP